MSGIKDFIFGGKKDGPKPPPPPANTPGRADASAGADPNFQSLIATGSAGGLKRKASGNKRSLIGGSG